MDRLKMETVQQQVLSITDAGEMDRWVLKNIDSGQVDRQIESIQHYNRRMNKCAEGP